jgi:predicted acyl esterase
VRGIHKSEGDYVMNRPLRGPLNATAVDNATDAYDSIDWLVKKMSPNRTARSASPARPTRASPR